jgi:hypothetical protein
MIKIIIVYDLLWWCVEICCAYCAGVDEIDNVTMLKIIILYNLVFGGAWCVAICDYDAGVDEIVVPPLLPVSS